MTADIAEWTAELASQDEMFFKMWDRLPHEFPAIRDLLLGALSRTPDHWTPPSGKK